MSNHLASVENWYRRDPSDSRQVILIDPIENRDVDPTRPPLYVQNDPELCRGLDYMAIRKRRSMHVNVSLGPGEDAYDLPPFTTERIIDEADAFAHDVQMAVLPEMAACGSGYAQRLQDMVGLYVVRKQVFCHRPNFTEKSADAEIFSMIDAYSSGMEKGLTDVSMFAAAAVLQNAFNWYSAAKIGDEARDAELFSFRPTRVTGRWGAYALGDMLSGFERNLQIAGVEEVVETPFRRFAEDWPEETAVVRSAALTGKLKVA